MYKKKKQYNGPDTQDLCYTLTRHLIHTEVLFAKKFKFCDFIK